MQWRTYHTFASFPAFQGWLNAILPVVGPANVMEGCFAEQWACVVKVLVLAETEVLPWKADVQRVMGHIIGTQLQLGPGGSRAQDAFCSQACHLRTPLPQTGIKSKLFTLPAATQAHAAYSLPLAVLRTEC